jgi:hypothetical protein
MEQDMVQEDTTSKEESLELSEEEQELLKEMARMEQERKRALEDLAFAIEKKFETRQKDRASKESEWLECIRLWLGPLSVEGSQNYRSPDRPWSPLSGKKRPDRNIVQIKCDIAVAQQISMQFAGGDKNWDIHPPAYSVDIDPATASHAAMEMEKVIEMQLTRTRYGAKARQAMWDRVVLGTGILKGPVNSGKLQVKYRPLQDGTYIPELTTEYTPEIERVDPWFFYPDDSTNDPCNIQDAIEVHPMSRLEVSKLKKNSGFITEAIDELLKTAPKEYTNDSFSDFSKLTDSNVNVFKNKYVVLEYHGPITLDQLKTLDIEPAYDTPSEEYYGEVWTCQGQVIRIELSNIEGVYETPYAIARWKRDPASVFGFGLPLILRDHQRVTTQTWHMILDNSSISSGPQVIMQKNAIQPMDGNWELDPRKVWLQTDFGTPIQEAFHFFVPPNVSDQLLGVLNVTAQFAEEESGVNMMSAGLGSPQVTDSATGQAIMNTNSSMLSDWQAEEWDDSITEKVIRRFYAWNMQYNRDPKIKGNFEIDVKSSTEYKNKLLILRDVERLSMEAAQNPELAIALNMEELTKARLNMMSLPNNNVVRTPEEIAQIRQQQQEQAQNEIDPNTIKMKELEVKERELALKEQQLQFEMQQQQMREMMDHEEKMSANYARIAEAEAQAVRTQNEKEIALIRMAQEQEMTFADMQAKLQIATMNDATKKFLGGLDSVRKNREQLLKEREYEYALQRGKGFL